jgi:hypothetical protein
VLALFKFRKRPGWKPIRWVSVAYPLIPSLYVGVNLVIFGYFAMGQVKEALWALATILAGALVYHLYRQRQPTAS